MEKLIVINMNENALKKIRNLFDETKYALVDFRLSMEAPPSPTGFPKFEMLEKVVSRLHLSHQTLFRLFRMGNAIDRKSVENSIPSGIIEALADCGLLVRENENWRTPSLLLVPIDGALVFVSVPPSYPTASKPAGVWFDLSSFVVARSLPVLFENERVLDICSGSGIQSILCAKRGAARVVGLEISDEAVQIAQLNAFLNGVSENIEFRCSDKFHALGEEEKFDYILCNTPYAPVIDDNRNNLEPSDIGNYVLMDLLDEIPKKLSENGNGMVAAWRSAGLNGKTFQKDRIDKRFAESQLSTLAFVDRAPDTVTGVLGILQKDVEQRLNAETAAAVVSKVQKLFEDSANAMDGFYNQLIFFKKGVFETAQESGVFGLAPAMPQ